MTVADSGEKFIAHYGIRGMKWGVRRPRGSDGRVSSEAKRAEKILTKAKTSGKKALTNKELGDLNKRLQLEQQLNNLLPKKQGIIRSGHKFTKEALAVGVTINGAIAFAKSPAGTAIKNALTKT